MGSFNVTYGKRKCLCVLLVIKILESQEKNLHIKREEWLTIPLLPPRGGYEKNVSPRKIISLGLLMQLSAYSAKTVPQSIMLITACIVYYINKHYQPLSCMVLYIVYININPLWQAINTTNYIDYI